MIKLDLSITFECDTEKCDTEVNPFETWFPFDTEYKSVYDATNSSEMLFLTGKEQLEKEGWLIDECTDTVLCNDCNI